MLAIGAERIEGGMDSNDSSVAGQLMVDLPGFVFHDVAAIGTLQPLPNAW